MSCFIGVEQLDGNVKYIVLNKYSDYIVPYILVKYNRENIEGVLLDERLGKNDEIYVTDKVYKAACYEYNYLFTKDNEWLYMDRIKHRDFVKINIGK